MSNVIRIDDERIRDRLGKIVRGSVEDTLNALLEAEAERLVGWGRAPATAWRAADGTAFYVELGAGGNS